MTEELLASLHFYYTADVTNFTKTHTFSSELPHLNKGS